MGLNPKTLAEVMVYLDEMAYPEDLQEKHIRRAIENANVEITKIAPQIKYGSFYTVPNKTSYDIFSQANPAPAELVDPNGIELLDVFYNTSSEMFNPINEWGLAAYLQDIDPWGNSVLSFGGTSDYIIWQSGLVAQLGRMGRYEFDRSVAPGEPLVLPRPSAAVPVRVLYSARRPLTAMRIDWEPAYLKTIEANACDALARIYSLQAGIRHGDFEDAGKLLRYWEQQAAARRAEAAIVVAEGSTFGGGTGVGTRS